MKIALLTDKNNENLIPDDQNLPEAFSKIGIEAVIAVWDERKNWSSFDAVLIRSPWDYSKRFPEFNKCLDAIERAKIPLIHNRTLLDWNMDKLYLLDLAEKGIDIVPTRHTRNYQSKDAAKAFIEFGTSQIVVKPAVGAGGHDTWKINPAGIATTEPLYGKATLLQPYYPNIVKKGEHSLIFFKEKYSHSVTKIAKAGEFRVQDDHGGTVHPFQPTTEQINKAENWLTKLPYKTLYARVDVVEAENGDFHIMELELVEPELFFRFSDGGEVKFAEAVKDYMEKL
jgi:glutathione synthase/RimK-type ligase-like ATP-grasp enzyme